MSSSAMELYPTSAGRRLAADIDAYGATGSEPKWHWMKRIRHLATTRNLNVLQAILQSDRNLGSRGLESVLVDAESAKQAQKLFSEYCLADAAYDCASGGPGNEKDMVAVAFIKRLCENVK